MSPRSSVLVDDAELSPPPSGRDLTVVSADGTALHAEVHGPDGGPSVVLVPGWLCTSAVWCHQVRALADDLRVVVYDQRGHGRSRPSAGGDYSTDALAADLDAVLDQAVPQGVQVVVAGHSLGAMAVVAWAHARRRQVRDRLAAVALCNVGVEDLVRRSTVIPFPAALATARTAIVERVLTVPLTLPHRAKPAMSHLMRALVLGPAAPPAQAAFCAEMLLATPADVRAAFGATLSTLHLGHGLPALTVPTVVVAGEHDRLTPAVHARVIAQALPHATFVELAGIGHMTPIEAPGEVSAVIRGLAARHLGAGRPPEETHRPPP